MSNITYDLVVKADGQEVHSVVLDSEALAALVRALPYNKCEDEFVRLLDYLAQSPSAEVRQNVAHHIAINDDTMASLAKDGDVSVRRRIAFCDKFKTWVNEEVLIDYIQSDVECAQIIASTLDQFTGVDINTITDVLRNHSDPKVRKEVASNYHTPRNILEQLLTDPEHSVRCEARNRLDRG